MTFKALLLTLALAAAGCADFERGGPEPPAPDVSADGDAGGPLSFAADVHPVLVDRCGACHESGAPRPFLITSDPASYLDDVLAIVDLDSPEDSLLLLKAQGLESHAPGRIIGPRSDDYQLILRWIGEGGAP